MTITGVTASLKWGYYLAGTLGAWTVTKTDAGTWTLAATVVSTDAGRIAQRPLTFVAPHQGGAWRWPVTELAIADGALTATLGPPQET